MLEKQKRTFIMSIKRISNFQARKHVQACEPFKANNIFAEWVYPNKYVVYSYGKHFPLFVFDADSNVWAENEDKYSVTTSKHRTQSHPLCNTIRLNTRTMRELAETNILLEKMIGELV